MARVEQEVAPLKENSPDRGLLVLITGPTGVGKDTVLKYLPLPHQRIVTYTTRPSGREEAHGHDYYFIGKDRFEEMIENQQFIEYYRNLRGDYYGTTYEELRAKRNHDLTFWRLNPDGILNLIRNSSIQATLHPAVIICLTADLSILAQRIRERGREKGFQIICRVQQAGEETELISRAFGTTEDLMFVGENCWTNESVDKKTGFALRLIENRQGGLTNPQENPDGFPRTLNLVEQTIRHLRSLWRL